MVTGRPVLSSICENSELQRQASSTVSLDAYQLRQPLLRPLMLREISRIEVVVILLVVCLVLQLLEDLSCQLASSDSLKFPIVHRLLSAKPLRLSYFQ